MSNTLVIQSILQYAQEYTIWLIDLLIDWILPRLTLNSWSFCLRLPVPESEACASILVMQVIGHLKILVSRGNPKTSPPWVWSDSCNSQISKRTRKRVRRAREGEGGERVCKGAGSSSYWPSNMGLCLLREGGSRGLEHLWETGKRNMGETHAKQIGNCTVPRGGVR